jgi:phage shock protein A
MATKLTKAELEARVKVQETELIKAANINKELQSKISILRDKVAQFRNSKLTWKQRLLGRY